MSYGKRYTAKFYDIGGHMWDLEIYSKDYEGSAENIEKMSATPLTFDYGETRRVPHDRPVYDTRASFALESLSRLQFASLFSTNAKEHQVTIKHKGNIFFNGFLVSGTYAEPYKPAPFFVGFQAVDGLILLKNRVWKISGRMNFADIVNRCLLETGLELNYRVTIETSAFEPGPLPLLSGLIEDVYTDVYHGMDYYVLEEYSYYEVLEDILKVYGLQIKQVDNKWHIVQVTEQTGETYAYREFNSAGSLVESGTHNAILNATNGGTNNQINILATSFIKIQPGYKSITVLQKYGTIGNLVKNSNFDESWNVVNNTYEFDDWSSTIELQKFYLDSNPYVMIPGYLTAESPVGAKYMRQELGYIPANSKLKIQVKWSVMGPQNTELNADVYIKIKIGDWYVYLATFEDGTQQGIMNFQDTYIKVGTKTARSAANISFSTFELFVPDTLVGGIANIYLYQAVNADEAYGHNIDGSVFDSIVVRVAGDEGDKPITELETYKEINATSTYTPSDIEVAMGDGPGLGSDALAYNNIITTEDGAATIQWQYVIDGNLLRGTLIELLTEQIASLFSRPKLYLQANIVSDILRFNTLVTDVDNIGSRKFMINRASFDAQRLLWNNVELLELDGEPIADFHYPDFDDTDFYAG